MKIVEVRNIEISPASIKAAIADLDKAIEKHTRMKALLEELISVSEGQASGKGGLKLGIGTKAAGARRGRRPRGSKTLRQAIVEVLTASKGPLKPVELKEKVLKAGYVTSATPQSFYTAVFNTASAEKAVEKTEGGFQIKGRAGSGRKSKAAKKTKKKAKKAKKAKKVARRKKSKKGKK